MTAAPGSPFTPVTVEMEKWGGRAHWRYRALYLGSDSFGWWLGIPPGTFMSRPGATYTNPVEQVCLAPYDAWWLATWHAPGGEVSAYVDIATPATWDGAVLRSVDLDLDVVRPLAGEAFVDDEDEFALHQSLYGYPPSVVAAATSSCASVLGLVRTGAPPFDAETPARWLGVLRLAGAD